MKGYQGLFSICLLITMHVIESNVRVATSKKHPKITKNLEVQVNYGRAVYINPKTLSIDFDVGDHCEVSVIKNDPSSLQIGSIVPSTFPCKFPSKTIVYQHYGSLSQLTDVVKLQVRLDTRDDTVILPLILRVKVVFDKPLDILKKIDNLFVDELGGLSDPIQSNILSFKFDKERQTCTVCFLPKDDGPPYFGDIVNTTDVEGGLDSSNHKKLMYVPCEEFLSGTLRYAHKRLRRSSKKDYLPLVVEVSDKATNELKKREYVQVPVRIRRATENQRPTINYNSASYSMQVDQLMLTAVTSSVLQAEDRETESGSIRFNVTIPPAKNEGFLVHTDDPTRPITIFYQREIRELKIAFKPPEKLSTSQRMQQIWLEARDNEGAASSPFYIIVVIKPMNNNAPQVVKNTGLAMYEGQSRKLSKEHLSVRDPDNEEDVTITALKGLFNGRLVKDGRDISVFTIEDLDNGYIWYVHDDSDTYGDSMILKISDGSNEINILFTINVIAKDDQPPTLVYNTGVILNEGESVKIDQFDLSARDVDTEDSKIYFEIITLPKHGYLFRRPSQFIVTSKSINEDNKKRIKRFSQVDIILGDIYYQHSGEEQFQDYFTFRLSDGHSPPNLSGLKTFIIDIKPLDDLNPRRHPGCPLKMTVIEGINKEFSRSVLRYTDGDSPDRELLYEITRPPYFIKPASNKKAGKITLSSDLSTEIIKFTQKQVNHFKVTYIPPTSEVGVKKRYIRFMFNVSDTRGNFVSSQRFLIELAPVNNKAPIPHVIHLSVKETQSKIISPENLRAFDNDNFERDLYFLTKKLPKHGKLILDGNKLGVGDSFTVEHVKNHLLKYHHDGSETQNDEIKFILSDGVHMVPFLFPITITPTDDETPEVTVMVKSLDVLENGVLPLNDKIMDVSDEDSEDDKLTFIIASPLKYGTLMKTGAPIAGFKLKDLRDGLISYQHTSGEIGAQSLKDQLQLNLTDLSNDIVIGGNVYSGIQFDINIKPVDSESPEIFGSLQGNVSEGGKLLLSNNIINIKDKDTDLKNVFCNLTKQPSVGYVETTSTVAGSEISLSGQPLSIFSAVDLKNGDINYVQSVHLGIEPKSDTFSIKCYDKNNSASEVTIYIAITPTNDEKPYLFVQPNIICVEDDLILFDLTLINPYDGDKPEEELVITVTKQPSNGELLLQKTTELKPAKTFTRAVLVQDGVSALMYQHKGDETTSDSFNLKVSDGIHVVEKTVLIKIIAMDDEIPRLIVNTGLTIERDETKVITSYNLRAMDLDSVDESLTYIVMMRPNNGKLQKVISPKMTVDIGKDGNFTQNDINRRRIRYTHDNRKKGNRDIIRLDVTDGFNRLINQMFTVMIAPEDNILPTVVTNGVTLKENNRVVLTTDILSASDLNTPDEKLQFVITKTPLKGFLQHLDHPLVPITKFSQLDLAANKISYLHTSQDEVKLDNFEFEVTDGRNKVFRTFRFKIDNVNNKKTILDIRTINALQDSSTLITPFELNAVDNDSLASDIIYKIHSFPKHGSLLDEKKERIIMFSQRDLETNRIYYQHDGSDGKVDSFSITVTDGRHTEFFLKGEIDNSVTKPVQVNILIKTVDVKAPMLITNKGASNLRMRGSYSMFKFSSHRLKAIDKENDEMHITFSINQQPRHGKIVNIENKNKSLSKFTQQDITNRKIAYILNENEVASRDMFMFNLHDDKKNVLRKQAFHLKWSWISFGASSYNASERDGKVRLMVKRSGNLDEISTVELKFQDKSAKSRLHYYISINTKIIFKPNEIEATIDIPLVDNSKYEKKKDFVVILTESYHALITSLNNATVTIEDPEDEPFVAMARSHIKTKESVGILDVPIHREGDISEILKVVCTTHSGTAKGTVGSSVTSYKDFISREKVNRHSIIHIKPNETNASCPVQIIDDSLYEGEEMFQVVITPLYGGKVNKKKSKTIVTIEEDIQDEALISFEKSRIATDESNPYVSVKVIRDGADLSVTSFVLFATKESDPVSARANNDYQPLVTSLKFGAGVREKIVQVQILDDEGREKMEGEEEFRVILRTPRNARLSDISEAVVIIDDQQTDKPRLRFKEDSITIDENIGVLSLVIERFGDLRLETYISCYTRQLTAKVNEDFLERQKTNSSLIKFSKRDKKQICQVSIVNDQSFESIEEFKVILGDVYGGVIEEKHDEVIVTVADDDMPVIEFSEKRLYVREPTVFEKERDLEITLLRRGDSSKSCNVMVIARDGSAISSTHYEAIVKQIQFGINVTKANFKVKIFHDPTKRLRTTFSLQLTESEESNVKFGLDKAVVFIEESDERRSVTFPLEPKVVSLLDYEDISRARTNPHQGYPLICVTSCNPKHPQYKNTRNLCDEELINNEMTSYRWQIAAPSSSDGVSNEFKDVNMKLFFTNPDRITLDVVYFNAGSRIRCTAQPFSESGSIGVKSFSKEVMIDPKAGLCIPRKPGDIGAETFSVQVSYTGTKDLTHKNLIKIKILIPHFDGLLPVISTKKLSNFKLLLSPDISRTAQHTCSNLLNPNEVITQHGFLRDNFNTSKINENYPHQFDTRIRGNDTIRFYNNLDLQACLWRFETYYNMSELVEVCGGQVVTDGLVKDAVQSHLTVNIPLFISYVYHSSHDEDGWIDFNHQSSIRLTAVYNTGILWKNGVGLPRKAKLKGNLYPSSIMVRKLDRKLQMNFRTKARFHGMFILQTKDGRQRSEVVLLDRKSLKFQLKLIRSDRSFSEPEQLWQVESQYAVGDYTGSYLFKMIPCTADEETQYSSLSDCTPQEPVLFRLNLTIQQTSEPVETTFTLNTRFILLNSKEEWLSPSISQVTDVYFQEGDVIYGRVMMDSSLGDAYHVMIEKVYLCSGTDGYIPTFNPEKKVYGCIADSPNLIHRFKILDRSSPETADSKFSNIDFNARLAVDGKDGDWLISHTNADGFSLESTPLFKVSSGKNWFLHVVYTLRSQHRKRRLGKRSVEQHTFSEFPHRRMKRTTTGDISRDVRSINDGEKGTNLQMILLKRKNIETSLLNRNPKNTRVNSGQDYNLIIVIIVLVLLLAGMLMGFLLYQRMRSSPVTVIGGENGGTDI